MRRSAGSTRSSSYDFNQTIEFVPNANYAGLLGPAENESVILSYYADSSNLKLDVQEGNIDVAYRTLVGHRRGRPARATAP